MYDDLSRDPAPRFESESSVRSLRKVHDFADHRAESASVDETGEIHQLGGIGFDDEEQGISTDGDIGVHRRNRNSPGLSMPEH